MDYEITLSENKKYVVVRVLADISAQLAKTFSADASELGEKNNICCLLVDERGHTSLSSVLDKYSFAHGGGPDLGLTRTWRIAVLKDPVETGVDFLETVMLNAGFAFRVFTEEDAAIGWLTRCAEKQNDAPGGESGDKS